MRYLEWCRWMQVAAALSSCCACGDDCSPSGQPFPRASHTPHTKVGEMSRALVLNATYEPLCVVPTRRALLLVLQAKAELLAATGRVFHSSRVTLDEPSVVRLSYFVRVPAPGPRGAQPAGDLCP